MSAPKLFILIIISFFFFISFAISEEDTFIVHGYLNKADSFCTKNTDSALFYSRKALAAIPSVDDPYFSSQVYKTHGRVLAYKCLYDSAEYYYKIAMELIPKEMEQDIALLYNSYGGILMYQNKFDTALFYLHKSNTMLQKLDLKQDLMKNYLNLGAAYRWERAFEISTRYNFKGLPIAEELKDTLQIIKFLYTIGVNYQLMKKPELAASYCKKALDYALEIKNYEQVSLLTNVIAVSYKELKKYDEAFKHYRLSYNYAKKANFLTVQAMSLINIGDLHTENNRYDSAMIYLKKGDSIANEINHLYLITGADIAFGDLYMKTNQYNKALEHFLNAIENQKNVEYSLINGAYLKLSRLYKALGNYKKAYEYHVIFSNRNDSSINQQKAEEIADLKMHYELNKKQKDMDAKLHAETERLKLIRNLSIIGSIIALVIGVLVVITFKFRQKQKIADMKNEIDSFRQRLMAQQMNPHFIFNTLSSIQYFIFNNKKEESMEFVSQFAQLMRLNLNNSQNDIVTLKDEIEALKLYLYLERIRLDHKFDFCIDIEPGIDIESQLVPSFLIQPIVENSIKHGILHVDHKGDIQTKITRNNGSLIYSVTDNGIGFEKSKTKQIGTKHISYGLELTKKRIALIGILNNQQTSFNFFDIKENDGACTGTKVELVIPSTLRII